MNFKQCTKCEQWKATEYFYSRKGGKFGVAAWCIDCSNIYMRSRHQLSDVKEKRSQRHKNLRLTSQKYRDEAKARGTKFYASVEGRAKTLLNNARKSPISEIFPCSVTLEHIIKGIQAEKCPVTGFPFELGNQHQLITNRKKNPFAPSIDRIDATKGYTNENTRIVIWQYNMAKGELTDAELLFLCRAIVERNS